MDNKFDLCENKGKQKLLLGLNLLPYFFFFQKKKNHNGNDM